MSPDNIDYNKPFKDNVKGHLKARFRLDTNGMPLYKAGQGLRHYIIDLFLETEQKKEIKVVHYYMKDPSYLNPDGYSDDANHDFKQEISSYGDVEIRVTVEIAMQKYEQEAWLSNMLENGHAADKDKLPIRAALQRIRRN